MTQSYVMVYTEVNMIAIILTLILISQSAKLKQTAMYPYYIGTITGNIVFALSDTVAQLLLNGYIPFSVPLLLLIKTIYFITISAMSFCWFLYYEAKVEPAVLERRGMHLFFSIPLLIQSALEILNLYIPIFYTGTADGQYIRLGAFPLQYIVPFVYIIGGLFHALYKLRFRSNYWNARYFTLLSVLPLMPFAAGVLEFFIPDLPGSSISYTWVILVIYLDETNNLVLNDSMTGLYNRRYFMQVLSREMPSHGESSNLYLMLLDVDYFKQINDTYGHLEGDVALTLLAQALNEAQDVLPEKPVIARYGGDEFIALFNFKDPALFDTFMKAVREKLLALETARDKQYRIEVSTGFVPHDSSYRLINDFILAADNALYEAKRARPPRKEEEI